MAGIVTGLDDAVLRDRIAQATVLYFTDWSHPRSGMARERSAGDFGYDIEDTVTTGGTGFGLLAQIVAADRGWRPRQEIADRLERIVGFLETSDRVCGVFPHFLSGATGRARAFMPGDDGGDLVETAFLMLGLLGAASYFRDVPDLVERIEALYRAVDWTAHLRPADGALMWHRNIQGQWSDDALPIRGWNEAFPVFVLGAGSPTYPLPPEVYHQHWVTAPAFRNGRIFEGIRLPLGPDWGGPLFLSQYPFLGFDPQGLVDSYADLGAQAKAHASINEAYCIANPKNWRGYGSQCWGLTASDDPTGYVAHAPTEDTGTIAPTAALSSMPFVPDAAHRAMRHFHDDRGAALFGEGGFVDAFCPTSGWVAESRLAIDQGPIVVALENHRSGLIWQHVMQRSEVQRGLKRLGFRSPYIR